MFLRHKAEVCLSHFQPILGRLGEADIKVALSDLSEPKGNQEWRGGLSGNSVWFEYSPSQS